MNSKGTKYYCVELISAIKHGDIITHKNENGTYTYQVTSINNQELRPIGMQVRFMSVEEEDNGI